MDGALGDPTSSPSARGSAAGRRAGSCAPSRHRPPASPRATSSSTTCSAQPVLDWRQAYEQHRAQRAARRRPARIVGVLAVLLAVFAVAFLVVLKARQDANAQRQKAESQAEAAAALALAETARAEVQTHLDVALLATSRAIWRGRLAIRGAVCCQRSRQPPARRARGYCTGTPTRSARSPSAPPSRCSRPRAMSPCGYGTWSAGVRSRGFQELAGR